MNETVPHGYWLWVKDLKAAEPDDNPILLNFFEDKEREKAFAALKTLKSICNETTESWLECEPIHPFVKGFYSEDTGE